MVYTNEFLMNFLKAHRKQSIVLRIRTFDKKKEWVLARKIGRKFQRKYYVSLSFISISYILPD